MMLSRLMTHAWSSPSAVPTATSTERPRIVLVIGATVTRLLRGRTWSRVKTNVSPCADASAGTYLRHWPHQVICVDEGSNCT
jgi:hypothetical protein